MMAAMSTRSSQPTRSNRGAGQQSAERYVRLGTQVPPEVKQHYVEAAGRHKVSLSLYFEMLAKVDPLAHGPLPEGDGQDSENT